jgi:hypothetical protein
VVKDRFREFPVGTIIVLAVLALIGLGLLIWGIVLVVDPRTRADAWRTFSLIIPDVVLFYIFYGPPRKWG